MKKRFVSLLISLVFILSIIPFVSAQRVCCKSGGATTWSDSASTCTDSGGTIACIEGQTAWVKDWGWYEIVTCGDISPGTQFGCGAVTTVPYHTWGGFSNYPPPAGYPKFGDISITEEESAEVLNGFTEQFTEGNQPKANVLVQKLINNPGDIQAATELTNFYYKEEAVMGLAQVYEYVLRGSGVDAFNKLPATNEAQKTAKDYVTKIYNSRLDGAVCPVSGYTPYDYKWSTCWPVKSATAKRAGAIAAPQPRGPYGKQVAKLSQFTSRVRYTGNIVNHKGYNIFRW